MTYIKTSYLTARIKTRSFQSEEPVLQTIQSGNGYMTIVEDQHQLALMNLGKHVYYTYDMNEGNATIIRIL